MQWTTFPNTARVGQIVLVGEAHGYEASRRLVERVLAAEYPAAVGLEATPLGCDLLIRNDCGLFAAREWGRNHQVPIGCLDISEAGLRGALPNHVSFDNVVRVANELQSSVESTGRVPFDVMVRSRRRVYEQFGKETHDILYSYREKQMARRLRAISAGADGPVVAVVGAFHVPWLADELRGRDGGHIEDGRVRAPQLG